MFLRRDLSLGSCFGYNTNTCCQVLQTIEHFLAFCLYRICTIFPSRFAFDVLFSAGNAFIFSLVRVHMFVVGTSGRPSLIRSPLMASWCLRLIGKAMVCRETHRYRTSATCVISCLKVMGCICCQRIKPDVFSVSPL